MHDVNFFYEYREKAEHRRLERLIRSIAVCLAAGLALGAYLGNEVRIGRLQKMEADLAASINDIQAQSLYREAKKDEIELLLLLAYASWLNQVNGHLAANTIPAAQWAYDLFERTSAEVVLDRISISEGAFTITGSAGNQKAIASFKSHLDVRPLISETSIQRVEFASDRYLFTISGIVTYDGGG